MAILWELKTQKTFQPSLWMQRRKTQELDERERESVIFHEVEPQFRNPPKFA
jgi:hypothetical protein